MSLDCKSMSALSSPKFDSLDFKIKAKRRLANCLWFFFVISASKFDCFVVMQ